MNEELKNALEALSNDIKGKTSEDVKNAISDFESKYKEDVANEVKAVKDELEAKLQSIQEHADKLDVKLQEKNKKEVEKGGFLNNVIKDNFNEISQVGGKKEFSFEEKDMTLANALTGDQPRDYNFDVVRRSPQMVNVEDLATSVQIGAGTYTFTRSTLASGSVAAQVEGSRLAGPGRGTGDPAQGRVLRGRPGNWRGNVKPERESPGGGRLGRGRLLPASA